MTPSHPDITDGSLIMAINNPPAFPHVIPSESIGSMTTPMQVNSGMSLRDWFAGQALPSVIDAYIRANGSCIGTEHVTNNCTAHAYRFADAMLSARSGDK